MRASKWALLLVFCLWISYAAWSTSSFQKCIAEQKEQQGTSNIKENPPEILLSLAVVDTVCATRLVYDFRDATIAIATVLIAIFTLTLWRSTHALWDAGQEQLRLARDEFLATHRPKLIVRQMGWDGPGHPGIDLGGEDDDTREAITIRFQIVNQGAVKATIANINVTLVPMVPSRSEPFPGSRPVDVRNNSGRHIEVASGGVFNYHTAEIRLENRTDWLHMTHDSPTVFVVGFVRYQDDIGTPYRTHFLRRLDRAQGRFLPEPDPEYEYQD